VDIESGYFFITDITGYTRFLTQSELDHAKEILDAIFDSMLRHVEAPLAVSKVEGDAIFCYLPDRLLHNPQSVLAAMEATYFEFRRQLKLMDINTTCQCNACANMNSLDLKVFVHHGDYIHQEVAGGRELTGPDVILAHRLMKNTVTETTGLAGYGLITEAAINATGISGATEGMTLHTELYEDFGDLTVYVTDLREAWEAEATRERKALSTEEALAWSEEFVPVPPWTAWAYVTDARTKMRFLNVETHVRTDDDDDARLGIGASFHCAHDLTDIDYVIVDMDPPRDITTANQSGGAATVSTFRIIPAEGGVKLQALFAMADGSRGDEIAAEMQQGTDFAVTTVRDIVVADLEAGVISPDLAAATEGVRKAAARSGVANGRFADLQPPTET
jgi:hypothetical protein